MMDPFFKPQSLVIVGVSSKPDNLGRNVFRNLKNFGFRGKIYLLGRDEDTLEGVPIVTSFKALPGTVDLAVFLLPAALVPEALEEAGKKGIHHVVIESGGFTELAETQKKAEESLQKIAQKYGMRFIGPNCLGLIASQSGTAVPFMVMRPKEGKGQTALLAQSGGVGVMTLSTLMSEKIGLSYFISLGNMLNVNETDLLEYFKGQKDVDRVALYLETLKGGRRFFEVTRDYPVPLIFQKANTTKAGARAALSHTAAVASDDRILDAICRQNGLLRARDTRSFITLTKAFSLPLMKGNRLAILSRSGGHAVIAADAAERHCFELPEFPPEMLKKIQGYFRAKVIRPQNPLDLGDLFDFEVYIRILEEVLSKDWIDGIVLNHVYAQIGEAESSRKLLSSMGSLIAKYQKPITFYLSSDEKEMQEVKAMAEIPLFDSPEEAVEAMAALRHYGLRQAPRLKKTPSFKFQTQKIREILKKGPLDAAGALSLTKAAGFPTAPFAVAASSKEVSGFAKSLKAPLALKVLSLQWTHKSDVGGVVLNLSSPAEAQKKAAGFKIPQSFLIQEMVEEPYEIFLGGKQDKDFGAIVMVGLGGIYFEALQDIATRLAPISSADVDEMLHELKSFRILSGLRGRPPADLDFLKDCLLRLSALLIQFPQIREIDINPLKLGPKKGVVVDARIVT